MFFYQKSNLYPVQWIFTTPGGVSTITLMQSPFPGRPVFFYQKCNLYPVQWISTTLGGVSTITLMQSPFFCLFMGDLCVFLPKM
ncbi:hypothetical protein [Escherichia coli]|uniref:hypothetical protein n=1 Tax=Escherichia coli TaxID=562 RepID=UPI0023784CD4|nr:hypothetical protein [Escherichia coli]HAV8351994.1 hypothetical protein [Escherichia coli]HAW3775543.1 hypothetical protein [Escherichia coli]